jgi:hypothetical protein
MEIAPPCCQRLPVPGGSEIQPGRLEERGLGSSKKHELHRMLQKTLQTSLKAADSTVRIQESSHHDLCASIAHFQALSVALRTREVKFPRQLQSP